VLTRLSRSPAAANARYNTLSDAQKVRFYESYCQPLCAAELAEKSLRNALASPVGGQVESINICIWSLKNQTLTNQAVFILC
jgi:hypothetical protein